MDLPRMHARALGATADIVAAIAEGQLHDPTPCEDYDVRALLNHVVSGNWWVTQLVDGKTIEEVGDRYDGDVLGDDPRAAYEESATRAGESFEQPGAMQRPVAVSYGPVPGEVYAGHRYIDVLIHGWDLAKATGQDTTLEPELVEACWEVVRPQEELLRGSGMFGDGVEGLDGADSQTKLLAALGRRA